MTKTRPIINTQDIQLFPAGAAEEEFDASDANKLNNMIFSP
jgi:hypothetical protein